MPNFLFICSKSQWRSPTAELLFKNHPKHNARSAGTSAQARIRVSEKLILWADVILVMEHKHRDIIKQRFASAIAGKKLEVLDIEDNYPFNDPELIELLNKALAAYIN